jgi:hypothetical protein
MWPALRRLRALLRRDRLDDELAEEISTHIDLRRRTLIEQGWPAPAAAAEARRQFGNVTAVREQSRDHWGSALLTAFVQDVRFGLRMITRVPALSATVVLIITIGAGINSAIFVFATNLLRAPDVPHADRLVWLDDGRPLLGPTYPDYVDYRDRTQAFSDLATFAVTRVAVRAGSTHMGTSASGHRPHVRATGRSSADRNRDGGGERQFLEPKVQSRPRDPRPDHRVEFQAVHHRRSSSRDVQRPAHAGR